MMELFHGLRHVCANTVQLEKIICSNKNNNAAGFESVIVCLELELIKEVKPGTRLFFFLESMLKYFLFFFNLNPFQSCLCLSVLSTEVACEQQNM